MIKFGDFVLADFLKEGNDSSSKRLVLFMAGVALSLGVIILTVASFYTTIPEGLMWALTIPLSGMAGLSYSTVETARLKLAQSKANLAAVQPETPPTTENTEETK